MIPTLFDLRVKSRDIRDGKTNTAKHLAEQLLAKETLDDAELTALTKNRRDAQTAVPSEPTLSAV
jgi:uncharacterized membrane protein